MIYAIKILDTVIQEHQKRINFLLSPDYETVSDDHEAFVSAEIDERKEYIKQLQRAISFLTKTETMNLRQEFSALKINFDNLSPESKLTVTITAENTGELMDLAIEHNCDIVHPFTHNAEQDHFYFEYPLKKNLILKVKSLPKKLRN